MNKRLLTIFVSLSLIFSGCSKDKDPNDTQKSSSKELISFTFASLNPAMAGVVDQTLKIVTVTDIPGDANITALVPTIVVSDKATVSPASGISKDFTGPVVYTVTAEDGTTANYTVTVTQAPLTISGSMTANRTLTDKFAGNAIDYIIDGNFYVEGNALLTIDPGVKIAFTGTNGWITVTENAGLKMVGTSEKPIMFTGPVNNQNKGAWGGIEFQSNRADNLMEYVIVTNAGSYDQFGAVHVSSDAKLSIKNCHIERSASHGLCVEGTLSAFEKNTFKDGEMAPLFIDDIRQGAKVDAATVFDNNALNYVVIRYGFYGTDQSSDLTLKKIAIPYFFESGIYVYKKLNIESGVNLLFDSGSFIETADNGILNATGTSELPVTFSHVDGTAGGWQGIFIKTNLNNVMTYCVVENGGSNSDNCNLYIESLSKLSISNSIIRKTNGYGVRLYDDSIVTASNVTFSDCELGNIYNNNTDAVSNSF